MARTIAEIQASIIAAKEADPVIGTGGTDPLDSTSMVAIWLLWTWIVAACQWTLESLFDAHKKEVSGIIATQKPHTLQWYTTKAKQFQYGDTLPPDVDTYPVIDVTKQVVKYAAAIESSGVIRIKVAALSGGVLAQLSGPQLTAFNTYVDRYKDAGVRTDGTSGPPDDFRVALAVFYDPLVLDNTGARLDGTAATPVQDAINTFLSTLSFNGLFVLNYLIAAIQAVEGVRIGEVVYCAARYGVLPYTVIAYEYVPDAGYMVLDAAYFTANTTYTPHGLI